MPVAEEMVRGSSRTDSISTLWSSADVPFCLDPRMARPGQAGNGMLSGCGRISRTDGFPRFSGGPGSSRPCSIDLERPSLSLAEERYYDYSLDAPGPSAPRMHDSPPSRDRRYFGDAAEASSSGNSTSTTSSSGSSNSRGRLHDSPPRMAASSSQSSSLHASIQSKRGGHLRPAGEERNVSVPSMPVSVSSGSGLMGEQSPLITSSSATRPGGAASSGVPGAIHTVEPEVRAHDGASESGGTSRHSGSKRAKRKPDLYAHAMQYFEPDYSMESDRSNPQRPISPVLVDPVERPEPVPSSAFSDASHDDSMPSCSDSHRSDRLSSEDSSVHPEPSDSVHPSYLFGATLAKDVSMAAAIDGRLYPSENTPTREMPPHFGSAVEDDDGKDLPSLPSLPSFSPHGSPSLSGPNSPRGFASRHASRPRTAEAKRDGSPNGFSPRRAVKGPPTPLKISRPLTSQAALSQALSLDSNGAQTVTRGSPPAPTILDSPELRRPSTTGSRLRSRALSTSKLRPTSPWKLFGGDMPALPSFPSALTSRPSTAQINGQETKPKGRFRSRTLGEADRAVSLQPAPRATERRTDVEAAPIMRARRPSKSETLASSAQSSARSILLQSATSASPSVPSTPKSPGRSRGKSSAGGGWASYLTSGLTLHIDQEGQRLTHVNMSYLSYDPFGSPEALVGKPEAKQATPRRPKSRQDRDGEASQVGTLEFGQGDEIHQHLWPIQSSSQRSPPILKHLTIGDDTKADLLTRQAALMVKTNGVHEVGGYEMKGQLAWKFVYRVEDHATAAGEKLLIPVSFSCSATLLDPARARKSRILTSLRKQVVPNLVSKSVTASPASSKHELPPVAGGYAPSPPSSYRSQASLRREYLANEKASTTSRPSYGETMASPSSVRHRFELSHVASHASFLGTPATSKAPLSANSISSTDSSVFSASQPITPLSSGHGRIESFSDRSRQHGSPVSSKFVRLPTTGEETMIVTGSRRHLSAAEQGRHDASPAGQLGLDGATLRIRQSSLALQEKASFSSGSGSSSGGHGGIQTMGPPRMIGGRKLIPISLPPELQKRSRIDPAQLQAHQAATIRSAATVPSSSSSPRQYFGDVASPAATPTASSAGAARSDERRVTTGQTRSHGATRSSSRPPTASEAIKLEYLAREEGRFVVGGVASTATERPLRPQRSHGTFVLTPHAGQQDDARSPAAAAMHAGTAMGRQRSRTTEGVQIEQGRPFTADAWGAAMYPPVETVRGALQHERPSPPSRHLALLQQQQQHSQQQQQRAREEVWEGAAASSSLFLTQSGSMAQRARATFGSRPRTAQNLLPDQAVHLPAAALVDVSSRRV
ncbi:uncharacterized protein PFL1_02005 [Pseudozyma flocculosa PF-1]|uniref:Uncharacterized protein n=1 Tax=Pseudozyma flocculosa TaxID=84751 RepID=A0A5C3EZP7_9BASI|nr:uncharacterized protein PFL1_02005 [Pseudozyma flocculosa PF-1]EPQ30479.1 hypothetical protein PFL1_02005 [Pseudozyma flocculosa PF-1]SPO37562.1 uncharacterized protein PSFLO_03037 [Pseudozyma flocculosa]